MRKREGIEPRHGYATVDADVFLFTEGHIKGAQLAMAPANPPGSKTVARYQGSAGNSGDPLGSSKDGSRVAQPAYREETPRPRGSRMPPYERRGGGNAHGAKGGTAGSPLDGNAGHTQRWTHGDDGNRADSHTGVPGPADALYRADAPLHGGQPARLLRGARRIEGARS